MWYQSWIYCHGPMSYEARGNGRETMRVRLVVEVDDLLLRELRKYCLVFSIPPFTIVSYDKSNILVGEKSTKSDEKWDKPIVEIVKEIPSEATDAKH